MKAGRTMWPNRGKALQDALDRSDGHPAVVELLLKRPEVRELPWVLACSGGADSVCLVLWCWANFSGFRLQMKVAHFHHNTRGSSADGDRDFVRELAEGLRLDFVTEQAEAWTGKPSEAELREVRQAFLRGQLTEGGILLTGHHLDDVMETQWMRLVRGTSPAGLCAPRPVEVISPQQYVLRPLLELPKNRILDIMETCRIPFREDASNRDPHYFRNRIRQDLLPLLKDLSPGDSEAGARITREWMEADETALAGWAESLLEAARVDENVLNLKALKGVPEAIWRRTLMLWLTAGLAENPFSHSGMKQFIKQSMAVATNPEQSFRISCGDRAELVCKAGLLAVEFEAVAEPVQEGPLNPDMPRLLPLGRELHFEEISLSAGERARILDSGTDPGKEAVFDLELLTRKGYQSTLWIRQWKAGDRYHPLGAPGHRKLQDCFTDRKIPEKERKLRPIVCLHKDGPILWCPGLLPEDSCKITAVTESALRLTYR